MPGLPAVNSGSNNSSSNAKSPNLVLVLSLEVCTLQPGRLAGRGCGQANSQIALFQGTSSQPPQVCCS